MKKKENKKKGIVYTPDDIVEEILNRAGYYCPDILESHIIDNSCGDGAFLVEIARRYFMSWSCKYSWVSTKESLYKGLETYIHGIEIDPEAVKKCIENLDAFAEKEIKPSRKINWDVRCGDTLTMDDYDGKMDFVVGNPPYVRIQNLKKDRELYGIVKSYEFCKMGSADIYMAFYEKGLKMLSPDGVLCYISPMGWLKGPAGRPMREYIKRTGNLSDITDFDGRQVFEGVTSYVGIFTFKNGRNLPVFGYWKLGAGCETARGIAYGEAFFGNGLYLGTEKELELLKAVEGYDGEVRFRVKNGLATLLDDFFIYDGTKEGCSGLEMPIYKASTGEEKTLFFPYNAASGKVMTETEIKDVSEKAYEYILENEERLKKRNYDGEWYGLGRSQGLSDTGAVKLAISNLFRTPEDLKITFCQPYSAVYSGFYVTLKSVKDAIAITRALYSKDFMDYVKALGRHKNGGYYTFTSKNLEKFLNWKLGNNEKR